MHSVIRECIHLHTYIHTYLSNFLFLLSVQGRWPHPFRPSLQATQPFGGGLFWP